jgi:hypothetical protein
VKLTKFGTISENEKGMLFIRGFEVSCGDDLPTSDAELAREVTKLVIERLILELVTGESVVLNTNYKVVGPKQ